MLFICKTIALLLAKSSGVSESDTSMATLRSPVGRRRTGKKQSSEDAVSRDSGPMSLGSKAEAPNGSERTGIFDSEKDELEDCVVSVSGDLATSPPRDHPAGRTKVQKLDDSAYRPWEARSRSSSEAGSDTSFCKGGPGKAVCGEPVRNSESGVSCDKCDKWYHASCQGIPKPAYDALAKYKMLAWLCPPCKDALKGHDTMTQISSLESKLDSLSSKVEDHVKVSQAALVAKVEQLTVSMKDHMKLVNQSLKEQEQSVDTQTKLIERSIRENVSQKATYADMVKGTCSDVVAKVSEKISTIPQAFAVQSSSKDLKHVAEALDSFVDKDRRRNNLVVHNLPEPDCSSASERSEMDMKAFQEVVGDTFKMRVAVSKCFRVGRTPQNKPRLLIVTLDTPGVKQDILRLAPQLRSSEKWGNIYITPDLTKSEREAARKIREELAARRAAGESNITIRRGRIVSTVGNSHRNEATNPSSSEVPTPAVSLESRSAVPTSQELGTGPRQAHETQA